MFVVACRCDAYCANVACTSDRPTEWVAMYEGWNFNSGNYLFTTDTK